jgi:hypothetical protein
MLLGIVGRTVYENQQLDDALDFVQVSESGMQCRQDFDGNAAGGLLALRNEEIVAKLSHPRSSALFCDMPGNEKKIAAADARHESSYGRLNSGKRDFQGFQSFVDGHCGSSGGFCCGVTSTWCGRIALLI